MTGPGSPKAQRGRRVQGPPGCRGRSHVQGPQAARHGGGGHDLLWTKQSPSRTHAGVQGALNIVQGLPTGSQGLSRAVQGPPRVVQGLSPYTRWRPGSPNTCPGSAAACPGCAHPGPGSPDLCTSPRLLPFRVSQEYASLWRPSAVKRTCGGDGETLDGGGAPTPSPCQEPLAQARRARRPWTRCTSNAATETLDECVHRLAPPLTPPPGHRSGGLPSCSQEARAAGKYLGRETLDASGGRSTWGRLV